MKNAHKAVVGKPEGKRPLGRHGHRWEDNIKMIFEELWWEHLDWINLAQDTDQLQVLVNTVMNLWVP
jgi:hypothetical protein